MTSYSGMMESLPIRLPCAALSPTSILFLSFFMVLAVAEGRN